MDLFLPTVIFTLGIIDEGLSVDLHFENPDSGFFLRPDSHSASHSIGLSSNPMTGPWAGVGPDGGVIDLERFTVLDPTRPSLVRATYGPFSTKQTVPARYVIPEFPDDNDDDYVNNGSSALSGLPPPYSPHIHQLEVSAHLVVREVTRARPSVRVLIHGAGARGHHSPHVCVTVLVRKDSDVLSASCTPTGAGETGGDATCLVSLNIPPRWWPPHTRVTVKLPKTTTAVSYMVGTASGPLECRQRDASGYGSFLGGGGPRVTVQPETPVGTVALTLDPGGYEEISSDPLVHVLVPRGPLHPGTTIHAPLYLHPPGNLPAIALVIRCKVRNGTRIVGVEASNTAWNLTAEFNQRRSLASVTAMLVDTQPDNETLQMLGLHEVFSWVLEVPSDASAGETKITWTLRYLMDALQREMFSESGARRMNARLTILKDDIQAVLPIAKSWSVVNTAVLTGRQVSRAMKVLIVSQAGKVADVTLQSSCSCTDEAALKVSSSCTSVYLDGSEVRGSHNATVVAKYGQRSGAASFTVWMPEFPLEVFVEDTKLSQMKGWKAPKAPSPHPYNPKGEQNDQRGLSDGVSAVCTIRYQQTPVQVYGRFVAIDDNSGRESYLLSRKASVRVTELVTHLLRVSDTSVASLDETILKGRSPGRAEVQVLSPITGRVIGVREVRVASDKIWISRLHATIISGLTLSLQPDLQIVDGYAAITTITPTLTAKYQEGLIDVWVEFSDSSSTPLRDLRPETFSLKVNSLDSAVVAVAPSPSEAQPRVIAIGHGEGDLLQVSLKLSETCGPHQPTLATTIVRVKVDLGVNSFDGVHFGDEHHTYPEEASKKQDNSRLSELPIADAAAPHGHYPLPDISHQPAVQARMHPSTPSRVTSLEVGMYVLLAVFGVAIVVFAGSCVVYTWRGKGVPMNTNSPLGRRGSVGNDSVTNAHDWVWLGRATLERASGIGASPSGQPSSGSLVPLSDLNGNNNPNQNHSWRDYHRFSKGMERTGLVSQMNITSNPGAELEPLLNNDEETPPGCGSSTTFTRPSTRAQRRVTFNNLSDDLAKGGNSDDERPPVPPHRNIGVSANMTHQNHRQQGSRGEICPPPVPPHGINVITNPFDLPCAQQVNQDQRRNVHEMHLNNQEQIIVQQKEEDGDVTNDGSTKFVEVNADDFVRLRGVTRSRAAQVRRATILENPLLSAALPDNLNITDHLDNLPPTMDYDQLLEYFSNLKESNA